MSDRSLPAALPGAGTLLAGLVVLLANADAALAHGDEESESTVDLLHSPAVAAALFLVGVGVLGVSIYLDYEGRASRQVTDAGVAVGTLCVLASGAALWI